MTVDELKKAHAPMTHKEWLDKLDKEEAVFRMFAKSFLSGQSCPKCFHYRRDSNGNFMCYDSDHEGDCREEFEHWLNKKMEE